MTGNPDFLGPTDPRTILAGLDDEQRAAVIAPAGPVCVLAGAGTGKTRAITHRIAYRVLSDQIQPRHVLAVTFTARAAAQLRERLARLGAHGVQARTFHAAALRQLRYFAPRLLRGREMPELVESKARAAARSNGPSRRWSSRPSTRWSRPRRSARRRSTPLRWPASSPRTSS